ncbi:hypothetical protein VA7868_03138 [Vibrio aerogenes CECT 7868]|uniref:Uncharacterized protein n=1 Tax=Vibrio aerogenes CECT 7868 TaxID=1216006 RepID=A0A1M5ZSB8_9VIBR|nr:hypothetical protein VA7868_03138 [Vibrio aerogenes CECT 7868]
MRTMSDYFIPEQHLIFITSCEIAQGISEGWCEPHLIQLLLEQALQTPFDHPYSKSSQVVKSSKDMPHNRS